MKKDVMENAIVSIAILVIAIFVISACGSSLERTAPAQDIQHTDEEQVGSFDDGSQMAFEGETVSDWKTAYLDYLLKNTDADSYADWKCWLAYIDGDEIPELFFYQPNAQFVVSFLACVDGQVVDLGEFGGQGAALWYQEKAGNLLESGAMMGNSFCVDIIFTVGSWRIASTPLQTYHHGAMRMTARQAGNGMEKQSARRNMTGESTRRSTT